MNTMQRRLGLGDSVVLGLGSMIGAGIFVALAPAAGSAGSYLLVSLSIAAVVAWCNATSSARLAAIYPESGGTYVYARERLGPFWGYLAGWGFIVGKVASCAAMALTVGHYAWPSHAHLVAVLTVGAITAVNYLGVKKSAFATRIIVGFVLVVLAAVIVFAFVQEPTRDSPDAASGSPLGVLQAAGLLFFAFAGYARIATLGEEVREPRRTIPRAINLALLATFLIYAAVAAALLYALGPAHLASASNPLATVVADSPSLEAVVRIGAVLAATGSLLALILGVSRTTLAMARDGHLPKALAHLNERHGVPDRAELLIGIIVSLLAATLDLRHAIGFSSFAILLYYLLANLSALTLTKTENRPPRIVPVAGAIVCIVLAFSLPLASVLTGLTVLAIGAFAFVRKRP